MTKGTTEETILYNLKLWSLRDSLFKKGCLRPISKMIELSLWHEDKYNYHYFSGSTRNQDFIKALEKLDARL